MKYERRHIQDSYREEGWLSYLYEKYGDKFVQYRKAWQDAAESKYSPPFPLEIGFELSNYCNLSCEMCYLSVRNNIPDKKRIDLDIIRKVMEESKHHNLPAVKIGSNAEAFMHPQIVEIIDLILSYDIMDVFLITNGTLLSEKIAKIIVEKELARLSISLDAATEETFKKIRGASLAEVEANIHRVIELKKKHNSPLPYIRVTFAKQESNIHEMEAFLEKWQGKADCIDFQDCLDYGNVDELKDIKNTDFTCSQPFQRVRVDECGNVYPCCTYYQKYHKLGNLKDHSLAELWNGKQANALRESFASKTQSLACKNCFGNLKYAENKPEINRKDISMEEETENSNISTFD